MTPPSGSTVPAAASRRTVAHPVTTSGLGVITGQQVAVTISPSDQGLRFRHVPSGTLIPAGPSSVATGRSWSIISSGEAAVNLVEHLLAALAAAGITDADVEVDGPELPLLDGSALPWADLIASAGTTDLPGGVPCLTVPEPTILRGDDGSQWLAAYPHSSWKLVYILDWPHPMVGLQCARFDLETGDFRTEIAPARTFALARDAEAARAAGIFQAGDTSSVLLIFDDRLSDAPALPDAFARHKLCDLLGDLYAAGRPWRGLFIGYNSGHALNHRLVKTVLAPVS
ncbi:MAG: UDP-3-O-acyl-N-acetylglucosamine deacetylase [Armatimonadetes bacterium]|nr:UDP-3-O-acyl-N-acetylglucosamine deacetylase [Armatimonadota bacterium]